MAATVLQLSDVHLTADRRPVNGLGSDERLQIVLDAFGRLSIAADLVLVTGDIADDGSLAACQRLSAALEQLGVPVLAVPGNHDRPGVVRTVFDQDSAEVDGWRVVGVDTSRAGLISGRIDVPVEMSRLDRLDARPTILAMHHPPLSPTDDPIFQLDPSDELMRALQTRTHVKAVASGHLHHPFELRPEVGPAVLGCPSTLISFGHGGDEVVHGGGGPTGARILTLRDDGTISSEILPA